MTDQQRIRVRRVLAVIGVTFWVPLIVYPSLPWPLAVLFAGWVVLAVAAIVDGLLS